MNKNETGFTAIEGVLGVLLVAAIAVAGYFAYQNYTVKKSAPVSTTSSVSPTPSATPSPTPQPVTYTSTKERLTFTYPRTWTVISPQITSGNPTADSFSLKSPSGQMTLSWVSEFEGIGGACGQPCPDVYKDVSSQKLAGANLYMNDAIFSHDNGSTWTPVMALNDKANEDSGLFTGINNGGAPAALVVSDGPFISPILGLPSASLTMTAAKAQSFFTSAEGTQAKQILLSTKY